MEEQLIDGLIIDIEMLDMRIMNINTKRGIVNPDEVQALKYKRCFLLNRLTRVMNGMPEEEEDEEWGELR